MDISALDDAVRLYCDRGIAESTGRTYRAGLNRYLSFCSLYGLSTPFPVSEIILCYFVTSLAQEGITPATIKTYLAAVRHAQIVRGLPEPRAAASPRLRLIERGIRRERARIGAVSATRLPITPPATPPTAYGISYQKPDVRRSYDVGGSGGLFFRLLQGRGDNGPVRVCLRSVC